MGRSKPNKGRMDRNTERKRWAGNRQTGGRTTRERRRTISEQRTGDGEREEETSRETGNIERAEGSHEAANIGRRVARVEFSRGRSRRRKRGRKE